MRADREAGRRERLPGWRRDGASRLASAGRVVVPSPSSPLPLSPQQRTAPAVVSAQLEAMVLPAAIAATPLDRPTTCTGVSRLIVVPSPSWPEKLLPQHLAAPAVVTAQLCAPPADTLATPLDSDGTATGVKRSIERAVAELAGEVDAPAPDRAGRRHRAAVGVGACRDGRHAARQADDRNRRQPVDRRAVAEPAVGVVAPAEDRARRGQRAAVDWLPSEMAATPLDRPETATASAGRSCRAVAELAAGC